MAHITHRRLARRGGMPREKDTLRYRLIAALRGTVDSLDHSYSTVRYGWVRHYHGVVIDSDYLYRGFQASGTPEWVSRHGRVERTPLATLTTRELVRIALRSYIASYLDCAQSRRIKELLPRIEELLPTCGMRAMSTAQLLAALGPGVAGQRWVAYTIRRHQG